MGMLVLLKGASLTKTFAAADKTSAGLSRSTGTMEEWNHGVMLQQALLAVLVSCTIPSFHPSILPSFHPSILPSFHPSILP
jgi:hypothetical protein